MLLEKFKRDTFEAIENRISLNPVLHSFQKVVNEFQISLDLIQAFFKSMEMDLNEVAYGETGYQEYIYGSAEVVGLMCLKVFSEGNDLLYDKLKAPAKSLGAAFQKVNFLRDMKSDYQERGRVYFPGIDFNCFKEDAKKQIEQEIQQDFDAALKGILLLPLGARTGVLLAYKYYIGLFKKIKRVPVSRIKEARIRVSDFKKIVLLAETYLSTQWHIKAA
jgi:phytoene/squalene synthetase